MKQLFLFALLCVISIAGFAQKYNLDSSLASLKMKQDSTLRSLKKKKDSVYAMQMHADSVKIEKEYKGKISEEHLKAVSIYPVLNAGDYSAVVPVQNITELPDSKMQYKLMFELTSSVNDSAAINNGLVEISRKINLHVASGVPLKNITPVIIAHGDVLFALMTNAAYKEKYKLDNPNLKIIHDLEGIGVKFIACGQAMAFIEMKREELLPEIKVALSAQTALSTYFLKGFVWYKVW